MRPDKLYFSTFLIPLLGLCLPCHANCSFENTTPCLSFSFSQGQVFYSGISFSAFETLKAVGADPRTGELTTPLRFCFGAVSGVVAQTCTYPLDVVRRRMQVFMRTSNQRRIISPRIAYHSVPRVGLAHIRIDCFLFSF